MPLCIDQWLGEALLFESTLAILKPPPSRTFDTVHHAFMRENKSEARWDPVLGGHSAELYRKDDDLVVLKQPIYEDRITVFVQKYLSVLFIVGACSSSLNLFL